MLKNSILYIAAFALLIASCSAPKIDRSSAPSPAAAPQIKIGDYQTFTLDNGLKVILVENHKLPRVSYQLTVDRDPLFEGDKAGYVSMAGTLLKAGTASKSKAEIDEAVDFIGARFNTYSTGMYGSSLTKHTDKLLGVMSDVLLNPAFPEDEIEKVRKQTLSGLVSDKSSADAASSNIRSAMTYGLNHPYGEQQTEATTEQIQRDDLVNYYETYFSPNISYLVIVGDLDLEQAKAQAEDYFGKWEAKEVPTHTYPLPTLPEGNRVCFVPVPGAVQSVINVTMPVDLKPGAPDAIAASVMNNIMGGGVFGGRLMQNLREDKAFTYGARSSLNTDDVIGSFYAYASVRNEVTDSSITEFLYELERITTELVEDSTLQFIKNNMNGSFARSLESPETIARFALNIERYGLPKDYYATYLTKLAAVTPADVKRVAEKYIQPKNLYITVAGNKDEVADKLAKFSYKGEVEFFDMYGAPYVDLKPVPDGVTVETVLNAYVNALGGEEKLSTVKSLEQTGTMAAGPMALDMRVVTKDNEKILMTVKMGGQVFMKQVFDGENGSVAQMGAAQAMGQSEINDAKMQADILAPIHPEKYGLVQTLKGIDVLDGEEVYVVEVKDASGSVTTEHYSVNSGLLLNTLRTEETPQGPVNVSTRILEYSDVKGLMFATKMLQSAGDQSFEITYTDIKLNPKVSNSEFKVD